MAKQTKDEIQHAASGITHDLEVLLERLDRLNRQESAAVLETLYDGYASANFGYEDGLIDDATLDQADIYLAVASMVARNTSTPVLSHEALEEKYRNPDEGTTETPEKRADAMRSRHHTYAKSLGIAESMHNYYGRLKNRKLQKFWGEVVTVIKGRKKAYEV
jgi:hypothetical protein